MPNIKQIKTPDNTAYDILDANAYHVNDTEVTDASKFDNNDYIPFYETKAADTIGSKKLKVSNLISRLKTLLGLGTASTKNSTTSVIQGSDDLVTSGAVWTAIDELPEPMVFKGSLGTGGTITALPTDGTATIGDTYKVITEATYAGISAKVGDTFICVTKTSSANTWTLIPSGDEPSGTVTSVTIQATSPIAVDDSSAITESGTRTISHETSGVTAGSYGDSSAKTPNYGGTFKVPYITVNDTGHVTGISDHTVKIPASDNTDRYVNSASFADDTTNNSSNPIKMTLTRAGSDTVEVTANIPKVSSTSAGVVPKGAAVSTQSQSTKFLRSDGTWQAPSYTTNTNTTYGFADGTNQFTVTPSDTGTASTIKVTPQLKIDGITSDTTYKEINCYGECSTAAGTAAKTVSITKGTFALGAGAKVIVKFTNANTANNPTLNVNSKGAKNIFHNGARITTSTNKALLAGVVEFVYDGTQFHLVGNYVDTDTTYTFTSGTNKFSVSVNGGTATDVNVTPSIENNITGTGTSGYLAKFNGNNTITSGPQLGSSETTFLNNKGEWATPVGTTYTAATAAPGKVASSSAKGSSTNYARQDHTHGIDLDTGDANGQVKIAGQNVDVKGLGTNAYSSTSYLPLAGGTLSGRLTTTKVIKPIVTGSGTAASSSGDPVTYYPAKWTFNTGITVASGDMINIKIPVAGHSYGVYLSINNGTTYYPVILNGTDRITTHFAKDTFILVQFSSSASCADIFPLEGGTARTTVSGGAWRVVNYRDTDTHYTTHLYAGASNGNANAVTTNGNTYLIACDNTTARDRINIKGTGATSVTSDANGVITVNSTAVNNKTIKIQQNGTDVDSFTLNQNTDKTINVTDRKVYRNKLTNSDTTWRRLLLTDGSDSNGLIESYVFTGIHYKASDAALSLNSADGVKGTVKYNDIRLGNNTDYKSGDGETGTANSNSAGRIRFYSPGTNYVNLQTEDSITGTRTIKLPNESGTIQLQKSCIVGQSGTISASTPLWYKVASVNITTTNTDTVALFAVTNMYNRNSEYSGILRAHIRTNSSKKVESANLTWVANSGFNANNFDFLLVYPSTASPTIELWTKINEDYQTRRFTIISEGDRTTIPYRYMWTLYSTYGAGQSTYTSGTEVYATSLPTNHLIIKDQSTGYTVSYYISNQINEQRTFGTIWKLSKTLSSTTEETIVWHTVTELCMIVNMPNNINLSIVVPADEITTTEKNYRSGYYYAAGECGEVSISVKLTDGAIVAKQVKSFQNGSNVLSSTTTKVYYR